MIKEEQHDTFFKALVRQFSRHWLGMPALLILVVFLLVGIYAPFIASSKPLVVYYDGSWYFPLFRYLFYRGFYTSRLDLFFNLLIFTFPLFVIACSLKSKYSRYALSAIITAQIFLFLFVAFRHPFDPAADPKMTLARLQHLRAHQTSKPIIPTWQFELDHMNAYAKLDELVSYRLGLEHTQRLQRYASEYAKTIGERRGISGEVLSIPTVWQQKQDRERRQIDSLTKSTNEADRDELQLLLDHHRWLSEQSNALSYMMMPLFRPFHWEDDAGGDQALNALVPWWELTRPDRKDLTAALIFGVRISIVVGISAVALALLIGVPFGCLAGYYAGTVDIIACRLMEIWEAMPTFFMLLLVVAITQSKSIFLVIAIIGLFGWTGFSRYIRGEFFKQRNLPYVEACRAQGFDDGYIIFRHVLPNAIPPVLTLLPFAIMGAISTESGLSFLGLGEENSCSWGVLMDEGRRAFPGESYLLWPPAILLTLLLVAIALVGDALRDAIDPRLQK